MLLNRNACCSGKHKKAFWAHYPNNLEIASQSSIWKWFLCVPGCFYFPSEWWGNKSICCLLTVQYDRLPKKKRNSLSENLIRMLSGGGTGEVICALCLRLTESGRRAALVLLLFCFLCYSFACGLCWMCIGGHPNQHTQPCVSFIMHTLVLLSGGKLLCCLLLWFSFRPSLSLASSVSLFSVIFMLSLPLCISIFDAHLFLLH